MMGHPRLYRRTVPAVLAHPLRNRPGRTEFVRVVLTHAPGQGQGGYVATSTGTQSSGVLWSMAIADGLLVIPSTRSGLAAGETATVQLLDGTAFQSEVGFADEDA
jgi:molybdopterin molybdotransferase